MAWQTLYNGIPHFLIPIHHGDPNSVHENQVSIENQFPKGTYAVVHEYEELEKEIRLKIYPSEVLRVGREITPVKKDKRILKVEVPKGMQQTPYIIEELKQLAIDQDYPFVSYRPNRGHFGRELSHDRRRRIIQINPLLFDQRPTTIPVKKSRHPRIEKYRSKVGVSTKNS